MKTSFRIYIVLAFLIYSCSSADKGYTWKTKEVMVSAYNSTKGQTDGQPNIAAWGDTLKPDQKSIAVSRDLIPLGFNYNTQVKIDGLEGIYLVKDKMHYRWRNKIDVYMGLDVQKARDWGRKKLKVQYRVKKDSIDNE
ncbi:3D domain-containing protein [Cytophaga sp. FL35]|uniref:3D domain-containing protein n=1 Tax=Cytophaga sp. FL35 TaxID=1904456 RepID=UPI0016536BAC|nr:3D domain-containing protein [Cytophaga sp. FL35]MBC7000047.1 3D domain-containing protein [Cytophaga sp. FL35]